MPEPRRRHTGDLTNICFDCQRATGHCPWSGLDPETGKSAFRPVPGWTAAKLPYTANGCKPDITYRITACPLYLPDPPRKKSGGEMELEDLQRLMRREKK